MQNLRDEMDEWLARVTCFGLLSGAFEMKPLESDVENAVVRWARNRGIDSLKLNGQGRRHWPDREFFILGGRPALIEFKRPGERVRRAQEYVLNMLVELDYDVCAAETKAEACAWLSEQVEYATSQIRKKKTSRLSKTRGRVVSISHRRGTVR